MDSHYPFVIIGAGPAGLSAAIAVSRNGIRCAVLDDQPGIGGQIYRSIETIAEEHSQWLGTDYQNGKELAGAFRQSSAEYFPDTQVWSVNAELEIGLVNNNQARIITADQILIASGAMERPLPFPGWTLPGVMYAGAGQILFKSAGAVPANGVVLAGSGPLLLLLAWQYMQAGIDIKALLDLTPGMNHWKSLPRLPAALSASHYLLKGLRYQQDLRRAGIQALTRVSSLEALGDEHLQSVRFVHRGEEKTIETDLLLTHFGVIPHIWLTQSAGCRHDWHDGQQCWLPHTDAWGNASVNGILAAGDGAGIGGAQSAVFAGRIAAFQVLFALGKISEAERDRLASTECQAMHKDRRVRPFLEAYFRVPVAEHMAALDDTAVVCRCEEITAGEIRQAVAEGHQNSNQVKFMTRCGMGPCQGRQCADAVAHIVAAAADRPLKEAGHYRGRPPVTPLSLGQLAGLDAMDKE